MLYIKSPTLTSFFFYAFAFLKGAGKGLKNGDQRMNRCVKNLNSTTEIFVLLVTSFSGSVYCFVIKRRKEKKHRTVIAALFT